MTVRDFFDIGLIVVLIGAIFLGLGFFAGDDK